MRFSTLLAVVVASAGLTVAAETHEPCATVTETVTVTVDCSPTAPVVPPPAVPTSSGYVPPAPSSVTVSQPGEAPPTVVPGIPPTTGIPPPVGPSVSTVNTSLPSQGSTTVTASEPTAPITTGPNGSGTPTVTTPAHQTTNAAPMLGLDFGGMGIVVAGMFLNAGVAFVA